MSPDMNDPDFFKDENLDQMARPATPYDYALGPNEGNAESKYAGSNRLDQFAGEVSQPGAAPQSEGSLDAIADKIAEMALQKIQQKLGE